METIALASKIRELRKRSGFSQEQLAEESLVSLRTIQRIEGGETVPMGDTLLKPTAALKATPDDVLAQAPAEDRGYLTVLHLAGLGFLIHPLLGILLPLVLWLLKKDQIRRVDETGRKLILFELAFTVLLYGILLLATRGKYWYFDLSALDVLRITLSKPSMGSILFFCLYLFNFSLVSVNAWRSHKHLGSVYFPSFLSFK